MWCICASRALLVLAGVVGLATTAAADPVVSPRWTLTRAIERARVVDESLAATSARADGAAARMARARAALLPSLGITASATRRAREITRDVGGTEVVLQKEIALAAQGTATVPLFDLRALAARRQARLERDAAALDVVERRRRLAIEVATSYLATLGAEQVLVAAERRAEYAQARLTDAEARGRAGIGGRDQVSGAELERATAERERVTARANLTVAYRQLGLLVGEPVAGPLDVPEGLLGAAQGAERDKVADQRRLDLEAERLRVEAAHAAAAVPNRGYWPTIDLSGQGRVHNEPGLSGENTDWSAGLLATWALFDGGDRAAQSRELDATARAAALIAAGNHRAAIAEVEIAVVRLDGARAARAEAERAATAAGRYADEIAILFAQGLARALEVSDAGVRRFDTEVALARTRFEVGTAYLDLLAATGGTVDPE